MNSTPHGANSKTSANANVSASTAAASIPSPTHSRPTIRRTPSELSALSKSILSLHDDLDYSQDSRGSDVGSDRSHRRRHRSKRDRDAESTPLMADSTRHSSFSFSSQSIDTGLYSDSYEGSSPLLYCGSFVDHQPLQRQVQDHHHQQQQHQRAASSQHTVEQPSSRGERNQSGADMRGLASQSYRLRQPRSPPTGLSATSTRSHSFSSQVSRSHSHPPGDISNDSSPRQSAHSSSSDIHRDLAEDTLIMPQIMALDQRPLEAETDSQRGRRSKSMLSASPTAADTTGSQHRVMTPSPVPLHARLSRIQQEARKGARILDMDSHGASHHYDYEDVTDSSHDFSSRRHSVAEEDVCYPIQSSNLDIDYNALEEYIRQEQIKTQKMMISAEQNGIKSPRGSHSKAKSASGGLLSKLKASGLSTSFSSSTPLSSNSAQSGDYGAIKTAALPERSYSLFGERDK
ncbi:hypothetical protein BGZ98_010355, partial [Dissophora globulifera]